MATQQWVAISALTSNFAGYALEWCEAREGKIDLYV
jgi:hypothetical protein